MKKRQTIDHTDLLVLSLLAGEDMYPPVQPDL